jgi:predicted nuclease of restriction endonuclease-like (RecB) superfamily
MKDPYNFGFVSLTNKYKEKELEQGLIDHIQKFFLELGQGFAFVGRQVKLNFEDRDYSIDLLFYHS